MSLVADIIDEAFREGGLITELEHPTPTQTSRALSRLQSIIASSYGYEVGELLSDWGIGLYYDQTVYSNLWQYPIDNSRLLLRMDEPRTIYFPCHPMNGTVMKAIDILGNLSTYPLTIDPNGRRIEGGLTLVLNTNSINVSWIYDAETGNWVRMEGIDLQSEMPLPMEFDDYFITSLAVALSPRYASAISGSTQKRLNDQLIKIRARYRQTQQVPVELALRRLPSDRYRWNGYSFGPEYFNRGNPWW